MKSFLMELFVCQSVFFSCKTSVSISFKYHHLSVIKQKKFYDETNKSEKSQKKNFIHVLADTMFLSYDLSREKSYL